MQSAPPIRPRRSLLFSPAANPRALEKAATLACDAFIFDLEDSAASGEKLAARDRAAAAVASAIYGDRERIVRVNGLDTQWGKDDLAAAVRAGADGVLVPKIAGPSDVLAAARLIADHGGAGRTRLWTMIETARALLDIGQIARVAAQPECNFAGFILGTNDIARETRVPMLPGRGPMLAWISQCVLAARAWGLTIVDSVFNDFRDEEGLRNECIQGVQLGMDGKTVIHPAQIAIANQAFAPKTAEIEEAERIVAAFDMPDSQGKGVIALDGRMVERLHLEMAQRTLELARAIDRLSQT